MSDTVLTECKKVEEIIMSMLTKLREYGSVNQDELSKVEETVSVLNNKLQNSLQDIETRVSNLEAQIDTSLSSVGEVVDDRLLSVFTLSSVQTQPSATVSTVSDGITEMIDARVGDLVKRFKPIHISYLVRYKVCASTSSCVGRFNATISQLGA